MNVNIQKHTDIQTHIHTDIDTNTQRDRQDKCRQTQIHTHTEAHTHSQLSRHTQTDRRKTATQKTDIQLQTHRLSQKQIYIKRHTDRQTDIDRYTNK